MSKLIILGAGGHGKVVSDIAGLMNKWDEIVFLDDNKELKEVQGHKVIGGLRDYKLYIEQYDFAFVAIGNNNLRIMLIDELVKEGLKIPILVHPFAFVSKNSHLGIGTVVMAGSVVNTNTSVGKGCIINTSSSVDHDCTLEDGIHISPGCHIGGATHISKNTWICIGASIANNLYIGNNVVVAAGSAVTKDVKDQVLVGGVPAKLVKNLI